MHYCRVWLKVVSILFMTYILSECSLEAQNSHYLPSRIDTKIVDQNSSKAIEIVFYRIGGDKKFVPTVKVNNRVVGSLLPDNYAKTFTCNENVEIGIAQRSKRLGTTNYHLVRKNNSNIISVKVLESATHKFTLLQMDAKSANKEIKQFDLKSNIINRYVPNCHIHKVATNNVLISPEDNPLIYMRTVYFKTDGFTIRKEGIKKIKEIAKLAKEYKNLTEVTIESYADYRASTMHNKKLAYNRALSVKNYFKSLDANCSFKIINNGEVKAAVTQKDMKNFNLSHVLQRYRKVIISIQENRGI